MRRGAVIGVLLAASLVVMLGQGPSFAAREGLPVGTDVDYQLGGDRDLPAHVGIIVRDRTSSPQAGRYNICYVNGFQTQPDAKRFWRRHGDLVLKRDGRPVVDEAWGEWLLDVRTVRKRQALARIVGRWTAGCASDGFAAVEYDNLDSFTRSGRLITRAQGLAFARLLVRRAHVEGLAAGQKNLAGYDGTRIGFDFAVSESCAHYNECGAYVDDFGDQVLMIEYRLRDFRAACSRHGDDVAIVLRDLDLSPDGVHRWC